MTGPQRPEPQTLLDLTTNRQMPDHARPNITLGELRAALAEARAAERTETAGLREIALELLPLAYAWVDYRKGGDVADRFETRMLAALATAPTPAPDAPTAATGPETELGSR